MKVQSHRKARRKSSVALQTLDTVTVTFTGDGAEQEPVVATERADQDDTLDLPGAPVHTIVFSALPVLAPAFGAPCRAGARRTSPYSGVSSPSCCRVLSVARGTVRAPE